MRERNGTSYAFGLRLWEIYNRRLIEATGKHERLVTHYDLFFENAEKELRRIANFIGLSDVKIPRVAKLVATKRRHTRFTIDQLIDAGVSGEVMRAISRFDRGNLRKEGVSGKIRTPIEINRERYTPRLSEPSRCLYSRPLGTNRHSLWRAASSKLKRRHKSEMEKLSAHLAHTEAQHKAQVEKLSAHLAHTEAQHKAQVEKLKNHLAHTEERHKSQVKELTTHLTHTEAQHKAQVKELTTHLSPHTEERSHHADQRNQRSCGQTKSLAHKAQIEEFMAGHEAEVQPSLMPSLRNWKTDTRLKSRRSRPTTPTEIEQLLQRIMEMNALLHHRSINLAEDEKYMGEWAGTSCANSCTVPDDFHASSMTPMRPLADSELLAGGS